MNRRELLRHFRGGVAVVVTPEESRALAELVPGNRNLPPGRKKTVVEIVDRLKDRLPAPEPPLWKLSPAAARLRR